MCGIVGFKGKKNAGKTVFNALKRLEYRGYDSWGLALNETDLDVYRKTGKIDSLPKEFENSSIGIGHTRWATHGCVSIPNAHPHLSHNRKIAVVHNGIIENFLGLRDFLSKKGYSFNSQTDSEVIPNLIQFYSEKGNKFREAVRKSLLKLDGNYAIVAIKKGSQKMIGARKGSPLVAGVKEEEFFLASDIPAFLPFTKKVMFLNDRELVEINSSLEVFNVNSGERVSKKIERVKWNAEQVKKGSFPHFMLKEIHEQPTALNRAIMQSPKLLKRVTEMVKKAKDVFFIGCGTSYHACLSAEHAFAQIADKKTRAVLGSEFESYEQFLSENSVVVAVSQSGETADLLEAVELARKKNAQIVSVVNVMGSSLTRLSDETIMMNAGPEICVLSTKSYTSQLAVLLLLAFALTEKTKEGKKLIKKTAQRIESTIKKINPKTKELASNLKNAKNIFLIGKNTAFPTAREAALKIKEVSYIHAEGFAGAELKHGTIALIEENTPVIAFLTAGTEKRILSNAMEVKARGAHLIGVGTGEKEVFDEFLRVPSNGVADPLLLIIPIQLLAYYLAVERGLDPDKPRNLAKSVTVK